ncbi:MAG: LPS export ABC transporter periplasmic protein LptC [Bdellovibrionales bacterium]|nr:LPS export ABC transporter periplasmic protein LptC [Bdellovibrionales bacterium]
MMRGPTRIKRPIMAALWAVMAMPQGRPSIEINGFHLVEAQTEKRTMEIEARKAKVYREEKLMTLDAVRTLVWGQGPKPFEVRGDMAIVNSDTQDMEIHKNARVLSPDGFIFRTDILYYDATNRLIQSEEPVEGTQTGNRNGSDLRIVGRGLLINLKKNSYEIKRNVRTDQRISKNKSLNIVANNLVIDPDAHLAVFTRKVQVKATDFQLKGERLIADFQKKDDQSPLTVRELKLDSPHATKPNAPGQRISADLKSMKVRSRGLNILMDPEQGSMSRAEAIGEAEAETSDGTKMHSDTLISDTDNGRNRVRMHGHVTIYTGERKGMCEEAVFYPDSGDIVLERVASVTNDKQVLEGEKIRFSTKTSDIFVERARGSMDRKDLSH